MGDSRDAIAADEQPIRGRPGTPAREQKPGALTRQSTESVLHGRLMASPLPDVGTPDGAAFLLYSETARQSCRVDM